jgi:hypothetical protein
VGAVGRSLRMRSVAPLVLSGLWLGCADDGDRAGSGAVSTDLPPDARLSELSDAQRQELCQGFLHALHDVLQGQLETIQCELAAVGDTIAISMSGQVRFDVALCVQRAADCVSRARDTASDAGVDAGVMAPAALANADCSTPAATQPLQSCGASVAQYERCWSAVISEGGPDVVQLTACEQALATLEASEAMVSPGVRVPPHECAELMELCPQISIPGTRPAP